MAIKTYNPEQVVVTVGGLPVSGFAESSMIKVSRDADAFTKYVGCDGEVSRSKSCNRTGSISITLAKSSKSNDAFTGYALNDEKNGSGVVAINIKDLSGTTTFFAAQGWVKKMPEAQLGKEMGETDWVFDCGNIDIFIGGNNF